MLLGKLPRGDWIGKCWNSKLTKRSTDNFSNPPPKKNWAFYLPDQRYASGLYAYFFLYVQQSYRELNFDPWLRWGVFLHFVVTTDCVLGGNPCYFFFFPPQGKLSLNNIQNDWHCFSDYKWLTTTLWNLFEMKVSLLLQGRTIIYSFFFSLYTSFCLQLVILFWNTMETSKYASLNFPCWRKTERIFKL